MDVPVFTPSGEFQKVPIPVAPEGINKILHGQTLETALQLANKMSNTKLAKLLGKHHYYITYVVEKPASLMFAPQTASLVYRILMEAAAGTGNPLQVARLKDFLDNTLLAYEKENK
jgi:hypothetical protein